MSSPCAEGAALTLSELAEIATTLSLEPEAFATLEAAPPEAALFESPILGSLTIRLHTRPHGCLFSLALGDGMHLCGLGALSPRACAFHHSVQGRAQSHPPADAERERAVLARFEARLQTTHSLFARDTGFLLGGLLAAWALRDEP